MCIVTYDDTPCFLFLETVNTVSLLVTVCDVVVTVIFVSFAVLPKCSSCPGVTPQRCYALSQKEVIAQSYPIQPVIQL